MQQPPGFPPQGPPQGGAPQSPSAPMPAQTDGAPPHQPSMGAGPGQPGPAQQHRHAANPYIGPQGPQGYGGAQGPQGYGPQAYGGPYGPPPAQGFGAGYGPPPIQPPQALEEPSLLHKVGGIILALATLMLALFWMITDSGLYLWLSMFQADLFDDEYYPALSFLLSWLGMLFLIMPVWLGIVSAIEGRNAFRVAFSRALNSWDQ